MDSPAVDRRSQTSNNCYVDAHPLTGRERAAMTETDTDGTPTGDSRPEGVPVWDDEYLDAVAGRLFNHYDLEREYTVAGERFPLYGELRVRHERHALHPSLTFAHHESREHVFVTELPEPTGADIDRLEAVGEQLRDDWIVPDETHHGTEFTFVIVADTLSPTVRDRIADYSNRTLIKFGYHGHYEISFLGVVPEQHTSVASPAADIEQAFRVWEPITRTEPSRLDRFLDWLSR